MSIRQEEPGDVEAIFDLTAAAFKDHPYSHGTEPLIINALRKAGALSVSLVAEMDGRVVGHIAFSPVTFTDGAENWYGVGPISVLPDCQRRGIGSRLIQEGLEALKPLKARGCVLVGDPNFYTRFGFESPDSEVLSHDGVPQENFMVLSFENSRLPSGIVAFHPAFWVKP